MGGFGIGLRIGLSQHGAAYAARVPASFNFASGSPSYTYTRTGAKAEFRAGVTYPFAANAAGIVPGVGYFSRSGRTNYIPHSNDISNATWTKRGGVTATTDGTTRADGTGLVYKILNLGNAGVNDLYIYLASGLPASTRMEPVFLMKRISTSGTVEMNNPVNGATGGQWLINLALLGNGWEMIHRGHAAVTVGAEFVSVGATGGLAFYKQAGTTTDFYLDYVNLHSGTVAGPLIDTAGASVWIGADNMTLSLVGGAYNLTITFDDGSTQVITANVSGGKYTLPVYPTTLNRPIIASLAFAPK